MEFHWLLLLLLPICGVATVCFTLHCTVVEPLRTVLVVEDTAPLPEPVEDVPSSSMESWSESGVELSPL
jgi:hypothetical protein